MTNVNWDAVFDLIEQAKLPDWDKETVGAAVVKAAEEWLREDGESEVVGTELYGEDPCPYKIDLLLRQTTGRVKTVDWKGKKSGKLDDRWIVRETRSWQPKIYAAAIVTLFPDVVFPIVYQVRGVTFEEKPHVKTVDLTLTREDAESAVHYLRGLDAERKALIGRGHTPWPLNPSGCQMFGPQYPCEFEDVCWQGRKAPEMDAEKASRMFSHSSAQEFLRCPERYRLLRIAGKPEEEDEGAAAAGRTFHAAMELIYKGERK